MRVIPISRCVQMLRIARIAPFAGWPLAVCGVLVLAACSARYSQVPPRVALEPYGRIALITFSARQADSAMTALATERFAEAVLASASRVELLELATEDSLAALAGRGVPAVFMGQVSVSNVKPSGRVAAHGVNVRAAVSTELSVRLVSTSTGGTLWRSSATRTGTLGRVDLSRGLPSVAVRDRARAYDEMLRLLVADVTSDFRGTWVRE